MRRAPQCPGPRSKLAVEETDDSEDNEWLSCKRLRLQILPDENGVMNRSVLETGGDILVASQFTLYATTRKGNRPSYSRSADPQTVIPLYQAFVQKFITDLGKPV